MSHKLTKTELRWLERLMKHRPSENAYAIEIPDSVLATLLKQELAHFRNGLHIEITFDGIREVLRWRSQQEEGG